MQCATVALDVDVLLTQCAAVGNRQGVSQCQEAKYDHLQDDERQCVKCRTTCYLSAITCPCSPGVLVCLYHVTDLCSCPVSNYTLK